jgi:hypothetical protein
MKKLMLVASAFASLSAIAQFQPKPPKYKSVKRTYTANTQAVFPVSRPSARTVVYQYLDTTNPNAENHYPITGNAGIGTSTPQAALEIKRNAGDVRTKNVLLQLSNEWSANGQNEPSIMFSNGDLTNQNNVSYWTVGARVSGDNSSKAPQTFKVCYKQPGSAEDQEFFSIDSYGGRVKIGDVNTMFDGYKLYVQDGILTEKVKVAVKNSEDWFDNVFNADYSLMPLTEVEKYITANKHLPDVPSTSEVMTSGIDLGKMNGILLKKIEELTLYMIEMKKELAATKKEIESLKK